MVEACATWSVGDHGHYQCMKTLLNQYASDWPLRVGGYGRFLAIPFGLTVKHHH